MDSWVPCALGMLPCANSLAGRPATLDACLRQPADAQPAGADGAATAAPVGHGLNSTLGLLLERGLLSKGTGATEKEGWEEAVVHVMAGTADYFDRFDRAEAATDDEVCNSQLSWSSRCRRLLPQ